MAKTDHNDALDNTLAGFFDAAKADAATGSDDLMARVLEDALATQAGVVDPAPSKARRRTGLLAGLFGALGGWPAVAGLGTAAVAGLWIGFSPALGVGDALTSALGGQSDDVYLTDYLTDYDFAMYEGDAG